MSAGKFTQTKCEGTYEPGFAVDVDKLKAMPGIEMQGNVVKTYCQRTIEHTLRRDGSIHVKDINLQEVKNSWLLMLPVYKQCEKVTEKSTSSGKA